MILASELTKSFNRPHNPDRDAGNGALIFGRDCRRVAEECRAVDRLTFHIAPGETAGLAGVNGAGKTTLIKLLCGMLRPSDGLLRVLDKEPERLARKDRGKIGVVFGAESVPSPEQTAGQMLEMTRYMYAISQEQGRRRLAGLYFASELETIWDQPVRLLSAGQRAKLRLTGCLLHEPRLLLVDEPTIGLDALAREEIIGIIADYQRQRQATLLISTHDFQEIQKLCSRVLVMDKGSLVYDGDLQQMKQLYGTVHRLEIEIEESLPDVSDLPVLRYDVEKKRMNVIFDSRRISRSMIVQHLLQRGSIRNIRVLEPGIEDVMVQIFSSRGNPDEHSGRKTVD